MQLYSRGNARRSLIDTLAFRAVSQISTILAFIVMVRGMTIEEFGVFNLLYAFIPVVSTVASLGLEQVLRRYQPEYLSAGNTSAADWLVRFVASARFATNILVLAAILLAWTYLAPIFKLTDYRPVFAIFAILILLFFQARILQISLASHMLHRFSVGSMAILAFCKLIGYVLFVWLDSLTLIKAIVVDIISYAVAYILMRVIHERQCRSSAGIEKYRPDPVERKRLFRYGLFNNFNDAGTLFMSRRIDNFYIAGFIDPISVGIYAFYTRLNEMVVGLHPVRLFENIIQPLFFALPRNEAEQRVPQYFSLLINMNLLLQWPVLAVTLAFHAEIIQLVFAGKFIEHSWMLPVMAGFSVLNTIAIPVTLVAQYEEKAAVILMSKMFAAYNVAALLVLIPTLGLLGAVLASGSSQVFKNLFIWWRVRDRARWINAYSAVPFAVTIWGGAVATCYALKTLTDTGPLGSILMSLPIWVTFGMIFLRGPAVSSTDRAILTSILRGKEQRLLRMVGLLRPSAQGDITDDR